MTRGDLSRPSGGREPLRSLSDRPLTGITLTIVGVSGLSLMNAFAKYLGSDYPLGQVVFLRNLFALLPLFVVFWLCGGLTSLRSEQPLLQIARGCCIFAAIMFFFAGLKVLGLAEATAIGFTAPLFITALSRPLLGEHVDGFRWSAVLIGFLGVLVIIRPSPVTSNLAVALPLGSAFCYGLAMNISRRLSRTDTSTGIAIWSLLTALFLSSLVLPFGWMAPSGHDIWLFVAMGLTGGLGSYTLALSYRYASAAVIAPFEYVALIWAVGLGWLVWYELPDFWTWIGVFVLVASGLCIVHRETRTDR